MSRLPGILADVADVAGVRVALELARRHGGQVLNVSDVKGTAFVLAVGEEAARLLVQRIGRARVVVPMAQVRGQNGRRAALAAMLANDATVSQAAEACDVHTRTAWRVKARVKDEPGDQPSLFEPKD